MKWVPGHNGIEGNGKSVELARKGASETAFLPILFCGTYHIKSDTKRTETNG